MKRNVQYIVLHCTAIDPQNAIETIKQYWMEEPCFRHPGYHYIIGRSGKIETLMLEQNFQREIKGFKNNSIHISYTGGMSASGDLITSRTKEQIEATITKLRELKDEYPNAIVIGQCDLTEFLKAA